MKKKTEDKYKGLNLYHSGYPGFGRNFTRDGIISAILFGDKEMLKNQLKFCALEQRKNKNPGTRENQARYSTNI